MFYINADRLKRKFKNYQIFENNYSLSGFTLAETLITLVIVGIIAALTVPSLINRVQTEQTISQLNSTYTVFSQALKMAELHNGKVDTWDIGTQDTSAGAKKLYDYITPEIKKMKDCSNTSVCFGENYKNLQGGNYQYSLSTSGVYGRGILANGVSFITWSGGSGCNLNHSKTNSGSLFRSCGVIRVDINGARKPNRAGYDLFDFIITRDGLIPAGTSDFKPMYQNDCKYSSTKGANGIDCTAWVLYKKNMDYKNKNVTW